MIKHRLAKIIINQDSYNRKTLPFTKLTRWTVFMIIYNGVQYRTVNIIRRLRYYNLLFVILRFLFGPETAGDNVRRRKQTRTINFVEGMHFSKGKINIWTDLGHLWRKQRVNSPYIHIYIRICEKNNRYSLISCVVLRQLR